MLIWIKRMINLWKMHTGDASTIQLIVALYSLVSREQFTLCINLGVS